jgi:flavin reductase (DIM6/NTAB) family NADH-FMN oxidoreductase RutF
MSIVHAFMEACKRAVFGSANLHQQCAVGLRDPQSEVAVWLKAPGFCRDVTQRHLMAAAHPLTLGVGIEEGRDLRAIKRSGVALEFRERAKSQRLLGTVNLQWLEAVPFEGGGLHLFQVRSSRNYCLPQGWLWTHYAYYAWQRRRARWRTGAPAVEVLASELRSVIVLYICPRPVVLVSVKDGDAANIFPMDLIGAVGPQHFALGLHNTSAPLPLLDRSRRIALSSVPLEQKAWAYDLGKNHKRTSIDWAGVPFASTSSPTFGILVPRFSTRVREMQIETARDLGSHKLLLARVVQDQRCAEAPELFLIHGIYQARRQRVQRADQNESRAAYAPPSTVVTVRDAAG